MSRMNKVSEALQKLDEYQSEQSYFVVPVAEVDTANVKPVFKGWYSQCVDFIAHSDVPGLVVVDSAGRMMSAQAVRADGSVGGGSVFEQPQTHSVFDVDPNAL